MFKIAMEIKKELATGGKKVAPGSRNSLNQDFKVRVLYGWLSISLITFPIPPPSNWSAC